MPRPVGYGRPGTKVIPDGWAASQAKVIANTLNCSVTIVPPGTARRFNSDKDQTETAPALALYAGPASVTPIVESSEHPTLADDQVPARRYQVELEHCTSGLAAALEAGLIVTIGTSPDPELPKGSRLRVTAVEVASRHFGRILQAVIT